MQKSLVRKGLVLGILILMLSVNIGSTFAGDVDVKTMPSVVFNENTLYVGGSGPNNYTMIQGAIDDAVDGDTVFVYDDSSPYYENVIVNKSIDLIGEDRETTIIDGNSNGDVVNVSTNTTHISGFTLQKSNGYWNAGITYWYSNNNIVNDNIFKDNYHFGVYLGKACKNNLITDNIFFQNGKGVYSLRSSNLNIISKNYIHNNTDDGVLIVRNGGNSIIDNIIDNNGGNGIFLSVWTDNNIVSGNIINNNHENGIYVWQSDGNQIFDNTIENNRQDGIDLLSSVDCDIYSNSVSNNSGNGVSFDYSSNNQIFKNIIEYNNVGLRFQSSSNDNVINKNHILKNSRSIYLKFSSNNVISSNNFIMNAKNSKAYRCINSWNSNYWNRPRILPMPILVWKFFWIIDPQPYWGGFGLPYPSFEVDYNPAQEPYDI